MFITIEGPEGSGKSTITKLLVEKLIADGFDVVHTREPGGTKISEQIREIILDKNNIEMDPRTEALLYAASRRQHLKEKVWPAIKQGKIVICDRYIDSSLAYQGAARNIGIDDILSINMFATEDTFPDLTLLFDIDPKLGLERINKNKGREVNRLDLEKLDFHNSVRKAFLKLADTYKERFVVIDSSKSIEEVLNQAYVQIKKRICK